MRSGMANTMPMPALVWKRSAALSARPCLGGSINDLRGCCSTSLQASSVLHHVLRVYKSLGPVPSVGSSAAGIPDSATDDDDVVTPAVETACV